MTGFCEICYHNVLDMVKHLETADHAHYVSSASNKELGKPRLPGCPNGDILSPFQGHIDSSKIRSRFGV